MSEITLEKLLKVKKLLEKMDKPHDLYYDYHQIMVATYTQLKEHFGIDKPEGAYRVYSGNKGALRLELIE